MLTVMGVGGASGNAFVRGYIFGTSPAHLSSVNPATGKPSGSLVVLPNGQWAYGTLVLGSALALFGYPHAAPGLCAAKRRDVIRRNAAMLPACMLVLGRSCCSATWPGRCLRRTPTPARDCGRGARGDASP